MFDRSNTAALRDNDLLDIQKGRPADILALLGHIQYLRLEIEEAEETITQLRKELDEEQIEYFISEMLDE